MSNISAARRPPRVLFFGMQGHFSSPSLAALLESGIEVCAIVVPSTSVPGRDVPAIRRREPPRRTALPIANGGLSSSIIQMAWKKQIPVWEVRHLGHAETLSTLAAYQADCICVACFSLLIPPAILKLPRLGCLNVHPSLLPANRGPVPLFWTFREGHTTTGVTIHCMDEGMDSGDILAQQSITVPDGISYEQLELQCASLGGTLLAQSVWDLYEGRTVPRPQDEAQSSYHSFPEPEDFAVYAKDWDARRVYNFISSVGHWDEPIVLHTDEMVLQIRDAISYSLEAPDNMFDDAGNTKLWVHCKIGWVCVSVKHK